MPKTFTIELKGKTELPHGAGARFIKGTMSIGPASEAVRSRDVELRTIEALFVEQKYIGSHVLVRVSAPGTFDNYASLLSYNLATAGAAALRTAGSVTGLRFLAVGE